MLTELSTFLTVSVRHCRQNATVTMAHEAASLKGNPPEFTSSFAVSLFKVVKRRERERKKRADVGKYFLQRFKKKKKKTFWWNSPSWDVLAVTGSAILCCERHSDIFTALQWNLWGRTHTGRFTTSNSQDVILAQILLKKTQFRRFCLLVNSYGKSWCCSHVCVISMLA